MSGENIPQESVFDPAELELFMEFSTAAERLGLPNGVLHEQSNNSLLHTYVIDGRVAGAVLTVCPDLTNCLSTYYIRMVSSEPWSVVAEYRGPKPSEILYSKSNLKAAAEAVAIHRINQEPTAWRFGNVKLADLYPDRKESAINRAANFIKSKLHLLAS